MNDIERLLNTPPDDFESVLYRAENWLLLLERLIRNSAEVSATLDASYDLLLSGLAECRDDDDDRDADTAAITAKTRTMVKQYRGFRDADTGRLLTHIVGELHALHAIHKGRAP